MLVSLQVENARAAVRIERNDDNGLWCLCARKAIRSLFLLTELSTKNQSGTLTRRQREYLDMTWWLVNMNLGELCQYSCFVSAVGGTKGFSSKYNLFACTIHSTVDRDANER